MKLADAAQGFLDYKRFARGVLPNTARTYGVYLRQFVRLAGSWTSLDAAARQAEAYLIELGRRGVSDHARRKAFTVLRDFYRWACERGLTGANPLRDVRPPMVHDKPRTFLARREVQQLLAAVWNTPTIHRERDHALLAVLYFGGLRVGEATSLRVEDVDLERGLITFIGKGRRARAVPVVPELRRILRRWLRARPKDSPLLFPSHANGAEELGQLDGQRVAFLLRRRYAPRSGLKKRVTPHTLRRSAADNLKRAGADLRLVQNFLGHAKPETTMKYLSWNPAELRPWMQRGL